MLRVLEAILCITVIGPIAIVLAAIGGIVEMFYNRN
jgi:hypothetical protein